MLSNSRAQIAAPAFLQMDLEWVGSTATTADFQIRLINTGTTVVKFNSMVLRGNHLAGIITGAGVFTWAPLNDNTLPEWLGWPSYTTNAPYTVGSRLLNFSSSTGIFTNATAPTIPSGSGVVVGTFRVTTTTTWTPNSDFGFVFAPTASVVAYVPSLQATTISLNGAGAANSTTNCGNCLVKTV